VYVCMCVCVCVPETLLARASACFCRLALQEHALPACNATSVAACLLAALSTCVCGCLLSCWVQDAREKVAEVNRQLAEADPDDAEGWHRIVWLRWVRDSLPL
jgi:ABC-type sulfate transport system permease component